MFDTSKQAVFYGGAEGEAEHRVWLRRTTADRLPFRPLVMILHNPSTAGKVRNDPTSRRGEGLAYRLGATDLIFVNLVTRIATDATKIEPGAELNCPWSDWAIQEAARMAQENNGWLVACWGSPKGRAPVKREIARRAENVKSMGLPLQVLRLTPSGNPEHPLYLPNALTPVPWKHGVQRVA